MGWSGNTPAGFSGKDWPSVAGRWSPRSVVFPSGPPASLSVLQQRGCPFVSATCPLQSPRGQGLCGRGSIPSGRLVPGVLGWATRRPRRTEVSAPSPACDHQPPPCRPVWGQLKLGGKLLQCLLGGCPCPVTGQSGGERSSPSSSLGPFWGAAMVGSAGSRCL